MVLQRNSLQIAGENSIIQNLFLCENVNIHVCTTAAEAQWSNDLVERHNAILGYTVVKTIDDAKYDPELALPWATTAKTSFGKNQNFPVSLNSNLPALKPVTSSQVVADILVAMHAVRQASIQN